MKKSFLKISLFVIVLSAVMAACYPGGPEYVNDFDVTYTFKVDPDYNWDDKSKKVYFMPDTVLDVSDPDQDPSPIVSQKELLAEVAKQLGDYGFQRELDSTDVINTTDFIVLVNRVRSNNYYYSWWYGWGGYWPGWGCCYYPPVTTVSNYRTASLTIQIVDSKGIDFNKEEIPIIWQGVGDGLFEGTAGNIESRGKASINRMFVDSPYLNRN